MLTQKVGTWQLVRNSDNAIAVLSSGTYSDLALRYDDGSIVYDFPGRIPQYVKIAVVRMFKRKD